MDTTLAFATKDALVARLEGLTAAGQPLEEADVLDAWPGERLSGRRNVIVGDLEGDQRPATLRAGGGTRDDVFRVELGVAFVRKTNDAAAVRAGAQALAAAVERVLVAANAEHPTLGVQGLRTCTMTTYRVAEFVHDKGRECDVHMRWEFRGRVLPT